MVQNLNHRLTMNKYIIVLCCLLFAGCEKGITGLTDCHGWLWGYYGLNNENILSVESDEIDSMEKLMAPYGIMFSALKADTKRCAPNLKMCIVRYGQTGESMVIQNSYG